MLRRRHAPTYHLIAGDRMWCPVCLTKNRVHIYRVPDQGYPNSIECVSVTCQHCDKERT